MPARRNLRWNTVDVRGADGLLHYGRVTDCTENGLIIDFGGGKAARQVPFGHIYRCQLQRFEERSNQHTENLPVDALWRLHREEPAKWYPGILLTGDLTMLFGSFALVRISTPHGVTAEVVRGEHLRERRSDGRLREFLLEKGQFVKEEIQLPRGVSSGSPSPSQYRTAPADQRLVDRFNMNCSEHWMVATHIDGSVLHVLRITDRFRRKFDRDYRSSCPKPEGNTLFRMLGVTPQTYQNPPEANANLAFWQDTPWASFSPWPPFDLFGPSTAAAAPTAVPLGVVPPFWGCSGAPMFQPQPIASFSAPSLPPPFCFDPAMCDSNGHFTGTFGSGPSFFGQSPLVDGMFSQSWNPAVAASNGSFFCPFNAPPFFEQSPLGGGMFDQSWTAFDESFSAPFNAPSFFDQSPLPGGCFGQPFFFDAFCPEKPVPINAVLPREILAEIFEHLDGVPQTSLRKVCSKWNKILTTVPVSRMFRVSNNRVFEWYTEPRICLLKRWTSQTKMIAYRTIIDTGGFRGRCGNKEPYRRLMCTGRLFQCIFQENQLPRLDTLVLVDLAWPWFWDLGRRRGHFYDFISHIRKELNLFASVCHSLVLKNVSVVFVGDDAVTVRIAKARIMGELSADALWSLLDDSLPPLCDADLDAWAEWMGDNSDDELPDQLVEILNERQSADLRDSTLFRGKEWTRDDLVDLDLKELNRITAHSLVKACCYEKLVLPL